MSGRKEGLCALPPVVVSWRVQYSFAPLQAAITGQRQSGVTAAALYGTRCTTLLRQPRDKACRPACRRPSSEIARFMGRHRSTIGRELRRNCREDGGDRHAVAQEKTNARRRRSRRNSQFGRIGQAPHLGTADHRRCPRQDRHWEMDVVIGASDQHCIVTLVERVLCRKRLHPNIRLQCPARQLLRFKSELKRRAKVRLADATLHVPLTPRQDPQL